MRLAVDMDDVLADLIACLLNTHLRLNGVELTREQAVSWDVFPPAVHDHVRYQGGYATLAPLPGAHQFMAWLKQTHRVFIVSYRGEHARAETTDWLNRHMAGLYDELLLTGGGKLEACRLIGAELIIDDSATQVPAVTAGLNIPGILMDTPMNRHIRDSRLVRRAHSLDEARNCIEQLQAQDVPERGR
jgi:5'(3')-deoxyribonucleotidase